METKTTLAAEAASRPGEETAGASRPRVPDQVVAALRPRFDGHLLRPGDDGYEAARHVWNGMVDRHPALIARCVGTGDVVEALRIAREEGLEVSVRGGGHSIVGHGVTDGGLMIDLSAMRGVHVDPGRRRAWVQGGALLRDLDRECGLAGLVTTGGGVSHTGVGGYTLGGGYGYLARLYGLACDNLVAAEVVTAAGEVLRPDADREPDLFWALRGGGGNFGIVTAFEFRLHPMPPAVLSIDRAFGLDDALPVLRAWADMAAGAPDELVATAAVVTAATGEPYPVERRDRPAVWVSFTYAGDADAGRRFAPEMSAGRRAFLEFDEVLSYRDLQRLGDAGQGPGRRRYWKSHYLASTGDAFLDAFLRRGLDAPDGADPGCGGSLLQLGGAVGRVSPGDTAFSGRDAAFDFLATASWDDPAEDERRLAAGRRFAASVEPFSTGRAYANGLEVESPVGVARAYGDDTYRRLVAVKDRYDPTNVFHLNQNIRPSAGAGR